MPNAHTLPQNLLCESLDIENTILKTTLNDLIFLKYLQLLIFFDNTQAKVFFHLISNFVHWNIVVEKLYFPIPKTLALQQINLSRLLFTYKQKEQ